MHKLHGRIIDIHVIELNIWIFGRYARDCLTPQAGGLEDICLVHAGDFFRAYTCHFKCAACDALYLVDRVIHIVAAHLAPAAVALLAIVFAKVDVAGQFAADDNIKSIADDFRLDRAGIGERLLHHSRPEICK